MRCSTAFALVALLSFASPALSQSTWDLTLSPGPRLLTPEGALLPGPVADVTPSSRGFLVSTHTHLGILEASGTELRTRAVVSSREAEDSHPHARALDRTEQGTLVWFDAELNALVGVRSDSEFPVIWAEIGYNPISVLALDDSTVVVSGSDRTPDGFGFPLHVWSPRGRVASFGADPDVTVGTYEAGAVPVLLARGQAGGFWAAEVDRPRMVLYDRDLRPVHELRFDADWLTGGSGVGTPETPPGSNLLDFVESDDGRIWVVAQVPDPDWRSAWEGVSLSETGTVRPSLLSRRRLFDTIVAVLDARSGETLATTRLDEVVVAIAPGNALVTMDRVDEYHADVRILNASLSARPVER